MPAQELERYAPGSLLQSLAAWTRRYALCISQFDLALCRSGSALQHGQIEPARSCITRRAVLLADKFSAESG